MRYFILIILCLFSIYLFADLSVGLQAHYPFNGNAFDESGNGYNGTEYGATLSEDRFGNIDCAYYFDEITDIISFNNILNPVFNSNTFSISIWFYDEMSAGGTIISKYLSGDITFRLYPQGQWQTSTNTTDFSRPAYERWHHIVVNMDAGDVSVYIDDQLVTSNNSHSCDYTNGTLVMGGNGYNGYIDDARIYDRTLTEEEIQTLYHEGGWMDKPQNAAISLVNDNFELSWDAVPGCDFYNVLSDVNPYGDFDVLEYSGLNTFFQIPAGSETQKFYQVTAYQQDEIIVNFISPQPDEIIGSCQYLLTATTPNPNIVRAEFRIGFALWQNGTDPYCDDTNFDYILCEDNTPGNEFSCLADFSQNNLVPLNTYMCLKAELFDDQGNSGEAVHLVRVDNDLPETIDLSATPSSWNGYIDLSWIAPCENSTFGSGSVEIYNIKISTQPIFTEYDFENAIDIDVLDDCYGEIASPPGSQESCSIHYYNGSQFPVNDPTIYYFAIKATDEAGNYSISNSPGCVAPYHEIIVVESIYVVNAKDSLDANYWGHTNYLNDTLVVSGDLTNNGNLDETVTVILEKGSTQVDSKEETIYQGTHLVTGLEYIETEEDENFGLELSVGGSDQSYNGISVWSIVEHTGIAWWVDGDTSYNFEDLYPAPVEPANEPFWVYVWMCNSNTTTFWDYPVELMLDTQFTANVAYAGADYYCENEGKKCYYQLSSHNPNYDLII